jgi:uncharacterized protein (DUF2252 family)
VRALVLPLLVAVLAGCGPTLDPRAALIVSTLTDDDQSYLGARPALVAGKYQLMASDPYSYLRGVLAVYRADWQSGAFGLSRTAYGANVEPVVIGDAHPENFGILLARDVTFALEPNDFDAADRAPYLWDVRRLAIGMNVAARLSNTGDATALNAAVAAARSISYAAAQSYAQAMATYAAGASRTRFGNDGTPIVADLFSRSEKDEASGATYTDDTVLNGGVRTLVRGVLDPTKPYNTWEDLPPQAYAALPATIAAYRATLVDPPPPAFFALKDAVREFGSGVASWPKVRCILLIEGPTTDPSDDVLLEMKELGDSDILVTMPPRVYYDDDLTRVVDTSRAMWAIPDADPLWGVSSWVGFPVQLKQETEGEKGVKVDRFTGERGTPEAMTQFATTLGALLARMHAAPPGDGSDPASAIAAAIGGDVDGFANEQAAIGDAYAQQVLSDWGLFGAALTQLGPTLGFPPDPDDAPPPDLAAVLGTPPAAAP